MNKTPIVKRLREGRTDGTDLRWTVTEVHREAADEIERLQADLTALGRAHFDTVHELAQMKRERDALAVENAKRREVLWWSLADDAEYAYDDWGDALDGAYPDRVEKLYGHATIETIWVATACLTVDENGDPDEAERRKFATENDARRCWPESLAAARAARAETEE